MRVLFINSVCGFGSTGRIVVNLAKSVEDSLVCYGRMSYAQNEVPNYKMTGLPGNITAALGTILANHHGFQNAGETKRLLRKIKDFRPDIIHLHNLHGYYLHVGVLFSFLREAHIPIVWTLHDCWPFTGYCPHYDFLGCRRFTTVCQECPQPFRYPFSLFKQNIREHFLEKKELFTGLSRLFLVTPSHWLQKELSSSFLKEYPSFVIHNGIDISLFSPAAEKKTEDFSLLFVASVWTPEKGSYDMHRLFKEMDQSIPVTVIGKNSGQFSRYPQCRCLERTENVRELAKHYAAAHLFVNMTLQENFPTVNLEALACGTPVLTYRTGGSPESLDERCGASIPRGNTEALLKKIISLRESNPFSSEDCVRQAEKFRENTMCEQYRQLYERILYERD